MTPSKSAAARDSAREDAPSPGGSVQPVQFTPARTPAPAPAPQPAAPPLAPAPMAVKRKRTGGRRFVLLVVVPLIALALGFGWWLNGGRYVTTDNSYVGADKVLITPQVTGPIVAVHVIEGQKVKKGDPLFDIDPEPYAIALALAKGRLDSAKVAFANLRSSYVSNEDQIKMGQDAVKVRQADFDRKNELAARGSGTNVDRDTSMAALIQAKQILEFVRNQQATTMVKLGGSLDASIDDFPEYIQAQGRRRGGGAEPAQHQGPCADRRGGDAGRADRARPRRASRAAGVRGRGRTRAFGSTPIPRNRT